MSCQPNTFRRINERIDRHLNPGDWPSPKRTYSPEEIRAFKAEIAATGVDIGGGRYPTPRSTAFQGPECSIAHRPWRNGMFLDIPSAPTPSREATVDGDLDQQQQNQQYQQQYQYSQHNQHHHQQYHQQDEQQYHPHRSVPRSVYDRDHRQMVLRRERPQWADHHRRQHAYERRLRLPPVRYAAPSRPRAQQQQPQKPQTQQEIEDEEMRQMVFVIANVDWEDDQIVEQVLSMSNDSDDQVVSRIGQAPGTVDWDNDPTYQRARTASIAESEDDYQQQQPRGFTSDEVTPNLSFLSTPAAADDSDSDSDIEYVNSEGVPFPRAPKALKYSESGIGANENQQRVNSEGMPLPRALAPRVVPKPSEEELRARERQEYFERMRAARSGRITIANP